MRPIVVVGWVLLLAGTLVLGMRTVGVLDSGEDRIEMVSRGATPGDDAGAAALETARSSDPPARDTASRLGIITVAFGILLVVLGSPGAAPSERRLIGT
jgi:hypothetical protein